MVDGVSEVRLRNNGGGRMVDVLKRSSIGYMSKQGYDSLKDVAQTFAEYEGFPSHANAIKKR